MKNYRKPFTYLVIIFSSFLCALTYTIFVFPNKFAPAGLNGLCTLFQYVTGWNMGYLSLLLNLPLAIAVYLKVSKTLSVRALTYVAFFSLFLVVLEQADLSAFQYSTETGTSTIMGPLVGGILIGAVISMLLRAGAYSGGTEYIASLIHKKRPEFNFFWVSFILNCVVAVLSFFVYDYKIEPVLMSILYSFASSSVMDKLNRAGRSAVRFEIVTKHPEELSQAIIETLHHSATLIPGEGIYKGEPVSVLICVVNKNQVPLLSNIIRQIPQTFAVSDLVSDVIGNFKRVDTRGKQEVPFLDPGEGTGI
ncbi:MAG: YitT family protein [Ruminococcaceae bacterium]|nr:YitT family protein [Oscillospiraceae bacterium]